MSTCITVAKLLQCWTQLLPPAPLSTSLQNVLFHNPSFHSMRKYCGIKKKKLSRWIPFTVGYREMNRKLKIRTLSLRAPSEEVQTMSPPSTSLGHIDYLN